MHELHQKLEKMSSMKDDILNNCKDEVSRWFQQASPCDLGNAVDMIKDLAEAEKCCAEAAYYKEVVKAMQEYPEETEEMMGYSPNRSTRTGRYTSRPTHPSHSGRMGYSDPWPDMMNYDGPGGREDKWRDERYGDALNKWRLAKRHYTETGSSEHKEQMNHHANRHVRDTMDTLDEIWTEADPELRKKMKMDLENLIAKMKV